MSSPPFILDNGFTFHAVVQDLGATWARATDPITAIRNAANAHTGWSRRGLKLPVTVVYGKADELTSDEWGRYGWKIENDPVPIGLFTVTQRSIKPTALGDMGEDHSDCAAWINDFQSSVDYHRDRITSMRLEAANG